ncbi:MAG TPA: prepilin-type N-terminal cleavage/methylation domain-containing protein [Candidatus Hydrogenedentes bacterium]|nr:prepilin-type N-terminal cleavage/methylation domain-containing protein [Candidatus Hydrogenedentota bacterium]HOL77942.1 prepilin-type N-terminal cleavage/methylation domain-containing protein [Candidatus Hydrogenedentota bacterium]HPO85252.1 prepilin-type N-terminal cleavage/methylation domain-containing protein [Candidatus Hydrogenedentota bacterium]
MFYSADSRRPAPGGFTLIELAAVVFLIGLILALGLPRLIPAIVFGELEGAARHLAGYGRALMAHCALTHEEATFHIDLDAGEYWSTRWIYPGETDLQENAEGLNSDTPLQGSAEELAWRAEQMAQRFERFATLAMQARSRNVKRDSIFDDRGPLFEKQFDLNWEEDKSQEEIKTDLLERTRLPQGVKFKSVHVGVTEYTSGQVEATVTPLGLAETLQFELESKDDVYSVEWDAITGGARITRGLLSESSS